MANDDTTLTYAGQPLCVDHNGQVDEFLKWWHPTQHIPRVDNAHRYKDTALPTIGICNWPEPPDIELNTLYWACTGASRWSFGYFLITRTAGQAILNATHKRDNRAETLVIEAGGTRLQPTMYPLQARQVTHGRPDEELWLLPLVDERYFWQWSPVNMQLDDNSTWTGVFSTLATALRIARGLRSPTNGIPANYLRPDPLLLTRRYDNAAMVFDACAESVGMRMVYRTDNRARLERAGESIAVLRDNQAKPYMLIAGGNHDAPPLPQAIGVSFPKYGPCGLGNDVDLFTAANPSANNVQFTHVIASTAYADYRNEEETADNAQELQNLTSQLGADWYSTRRYHYDITLAGVFPWDATIFDDYLVFYLGHELPKDPLVRTQSIENSDYNQVLTAANLETQHGSRITTRCKSLPPTYGLVQQFSQSIDVTPAPVGAFFAELKDDCLQPGGSATFYRLLWDTENDKYSRVQVGDPPADQELTIYDSCHRNFLLKGECVWAAPAPVPAQEIGCEPERYEIMGENGLHRRAKLDAEDGLNCDNEGPAIVYGPKVGSGEENECDGTPSECTITICNKWGYRRKIWNNEELEVWYDTGTRKWYPHHQQQNVRGEIVVRNEPLCNDTERLEITDNGDLTWYDYCRKMYGPFYYDGQNKLQFENHFGLANCLGQTVVVDWIEEAQQWAITQADHRIQKVYESFPRDAGSGSDSACGINGVPRNIVIMHCCEGALEPEPIVAFKETTVVAGPVESQNCDGAVATKKICVLDYEDDEDVNLFDVEYATVVESVFLTGGGTSGQPECIVASYTTLTVLCENKGSGVPVICCDAGICNPNPDDCDDCPTPSYTPIAQVTYNGPGNQGVTLGPLNMQWNAVEGEWQVLLQFNVTDPVTATLHEYAVYARLTCDFATGPVFSGGISCADTGALANTWVPNQLDYGDTGTISTSTAALPGCTNDPASNDSALTFEIFLPDCDPDAAPQMRWAGYAE